MRNRKWTGAAIFLVLLLLVTGPFASAGSVFAVETDLRIDLQVINLEDDGSINSNSEFWVRQAINAAADISTSGSGDALELPWLLLTMPKSNRTTRPTFIDSQKARRTIRYEDADHFYVLYQFDRLTGGERMTFPFPFSFTDEVEDRYELPVSLKLVSARDVEDSAALDAAQSVEKAKTLPVIKEIEKRYMARKQVLLYTETDKFVHDANSWRRDEDIYVFKVPVSQGAADSGVGNRSGWIRINIKAPRPSDIEGNASFERLDATDVEVQLPAGMTLKNKVDNTRYFFDEATNTARVRINRPNTEKGHNIEHWFDIAFDHQPFDTPFTLSFRSYVNRGEDTERVLPTQTVKVLLEPEYFTSTGALDAWKDNLSGAGEFPYPFHVYEGNYTIYGGRIYDKAGRDLTEQGIYYSQILGNRNNGSAYDDPTNGMVTDLYSFTDYIIDKAGKDHRLRYLNFMPDWVVSVRNDAGYTDEMRQADVSRLTEIFNGTDNVLYGLTRDGQEVELARNIKYRQKVDIDDAQGRYYAIRLDFARPIRLDNMRLSFHTGVLPTDEELAKYADGTYTAAVRYHGAFAATSVTAKDPAAEADSKKSQDLHDSLAWTALHPVNPRMRFTSGGDITLPYSATGTYTDQITTAAWFGNGNWGPLANEPITDVKVIALLPPEFDVAPDHTGRFYGYAGDASRYAEPEVVRNYKNTGRTAVIIAHDPINFQTNREQMFIRLRITASPYAKQGRNAVDFYATYSNNGVILPDEAKREYVDALDLDNDGNMTEIFAHTVTYINYIPPLELIISKKVGVDEGEPGTMATGDLGEPAYYALSLFNNTIAEVKKASVIDVLPYKGDHTIVPDKEGAYAGRESAFPVYLEGALEDMEKNETVKDRFDFFYQTAPQGVDVESVRDGVWLTKDQVSDFSKVKSIKISLKDGQKILSKEEVILYMPIRLPKETTAEKGETAVNTAAISTDGHLYAEGNKAFLTYQTYKVKGVLFVDENRNGVRDENERGASGRPVELLKADTGEVMTDQWGRPYRTTTGTDGAYEIPVHTRGAYRVRFTPLEGATYTETVVDTVDGNHVEAFGDGFATTEVSVTPSVPEGIRNGGIIYPPVPVTSVSVRKAWVDYTGAPLADGIKDPLTVEAELLRDGEPTGRTVTLNRGNNWEATFVNLPDRATYDGVSYMYSVREKEADDRGMIHLDSFWYKVVLSGSQEQGYTLTNHRLMPWTALTPGIPLRKIRVEKKWLGHTGEELSEEMKAELGERLAVEAELLRDGEATGQTVVLRPENNWTAEFTDLPDRPTHDGASYKYTVRENGLNERGMVKLGDSWFKAQEVSGDASSGYVLTNRRQLPWTALTPGIPLRKIRVEKKWLEHTGEELSEEMKAELGERLAVEAELLRDGEATGQTVVLRPENNWTAEFTDLPDRPTHDGASYKYTVRENGLNERGMVKLGDSWFKAQEVSGDASSGYVLTNRRQLPWTALTPGIPLRKIRVEKKWLEHTGEELSEEMKAELGERLAVEAELLRDGEATGQTVVLRPENNWTAEFTDLPDRPAHDGVSYKYTVRENGLNERGMVKLGDSWFKAQEVSGDASSGYVLTNRRQLPWTALTPGIPLRKIRVEKKWLDHTGEELSEEMKAELGESLAVEAELLRDGEATGQTVVLRPDNNWTAEFTDLPDRPTHDGASYKYTVRENGLNEQNMVKLGDSWFKAQEVRGDAASGYVLTNRRQLPWTALTPGIPLRKIRVEKKWLEHTGEELSEEMKAELGERLAVEAELLRDGEATGQTVVLRPENNWTAEFTDLPDRPTHDGVPYEYTVRENGLNERGMVKLGDSWFKAQEVTGDTASGYVLTNRRQLPWMALMPGKKIEKPKQSIAPRPAVEKKASAPQTGDQNSIWLRMIALLAAVFAVGGYLVWRVVGKRKEGRV